MTVQILVLQSSFSFSNLHFPLSLFWFYFQFHALLRFCSYALRMCFFSSLKLDFPDFLFSLHQNDKIPIALQKFTGLCPRSNYPTAQQPVADQVVATQSIQVPLKTRTLREIANAATIKICLHFFSFVCIYPAQTLKELIALYAISSTYYTISNCSFLTDVSLPHDDDSLLVARPFKKSKKNVQSYYLVI